MHSPAFPEGYDLHPLWADDCCEGFSEGASYQLSGYELTGDSSDHGDEFPADDVEVFSVRPVSSLTGRS